MKRNGKRQTSLTQSREDAKVSRLATSLCASAPLREIDTEFVSRKALAAGSSVSLTLCFVAMIGGLSQ